MLSKLVFYGLLTRREIRFFLFLKIACVLLVCNGCSYDAKETNIVFVGDLLLDRGVRVRIEHLGVDSLFDQSIDDVFSENDIVIANLECPATTICLLYTSPSPRD